MGRIWTLALAMVLALFVVRIAGPLGGATTLLTASIGVGAGTAAAYLGSAAISARTRGLWLLVGIVFGALGYVMGAAVFPDTLNGLFIGGCVPIVLGALATTWTRSQTAFLCTVLGSGTLTGVYAKRFDLDPQSLNYSLPVAIGQAVFPLALGFIVASVVRGAIPDDDAVAANAPDPQAQVAELDDATTDAKVA